MRATLSPVSTIAERLKEAMDAEGLNQNQLKERLGLKNDGYLSNVFKRNSDGLRPQTLAKLSKALRVRYDWLATGDGPMREALVDEGPVVELDARYPNAARAAVLAREEGVADDAIEAVLHDSLKSLGDLPMSEWLRQMVDRAAFFAKMRAQTPAQKQAEVDDSRQLVSDLEREADEIRRQKRAAREAAKHKESAG